MFVLFFFMMQRDAAHSILGALLTALIGVVLWNNMLQLTQDGEILEGVASGDGPIDAAFNAIDNGIGHHYELDDLQIQAVTEGKAALGAALVRLRSDGKLYSGNGLSTDIVGASVRAYINALNKIVFEEQS